MTSMQVTLYHSASPVNYRRHDMQAQAFGPWLEHQLDRRGWSQAEFARRLDRTTGTVNLWVRSGRTPNPQSCDLIAEALDIDRDVVLAQAGHRPDEPDLDPDSIQAEIIERVRKVKTDIPSNNIILLGILETLKENIKNRPYPGTTPAPSQVSQSKERTP